MLESPSDRCGFEWDDGPHANCCYRKTWGNRDLCIWHAEVTKGESKPLNKLQEVRETEANRRLNSGRQPGFHFQTNGNSKSPSLSPPAELLDGVNLAEAGPITGFSFSHCWIRDGKFFHSHLRNISFFFANLKGSNFSNANGSGIDFMGSHLQGAQFHQAHLTDVGFHTANLSDMGSYGAYFTEVDFHNADLSGSQLKDASLLRTDLNGSSLVDSGLYGARLTDVRINETTNFGDRCIYEKRVSSEEDKNEINDYLDQAIWTYRTQQRIYRENSIPDRIAKFYIREKDCRRKQAYHNKDWCDWMKYASSRWIMLYGESPWRVIYTSIGSIIAFAGLYSLLYETSISNSLYLSVVTFSTLGHNGIQPVSSLTKFLISSQSLLGGAMIALFIVVLSRRIIR